MVKKMLIVLTLLLLLVVSTTPALAQKPSDPNGKGNSVNDDHGKGSSADNNGGNRNHANSTVQNPGTTISNDKDVNTTNNSSGHGFDEWGYNHTARIFNGTAWDWCIVKFDDETYCEDYLGDYANDHLVMKWNAEWDRGNAEGWAFPPYDAWESNLWIGNGSGRSGEVSHYKFVWVGPCVDGTTFPNGGYCIWSQFEVLMDMGVDGGVHYWSAHAIPSGYGSYPYPR